MKTKLLYILLLLSGVNYAQQDAQFTQYMYNTININPAYAGSRGSMSVFALHRTQWVGLDGAPVTNTVSFNTPIKESNLGLGVSVISDKIGPSEETNLALDMSYSINTSDRFKLSFGIKASANLLNIDFNKLSQYDSGDNIFAFKKKSRDGEKTLVLIANLDENNWKRVEYIDFYKLFDSEKIKDISIGHQMEKVPNWFEYYLKPYEIKLFYKD